MLSQRKTSTGKEIIITKKGQLFFGFVTDFNALDSHTINPKPNLNSIVIFLMKIIDQSEIVICLTEILRNKTACFLQHLTFDIAPNLLALHTFQ